MGLQGKGKAAGAYVSKQEDRDLIMQNLANHVKIFFFFGRATGNYISKNVKQGSDRIRRAPSKDLWLLSNDGAMWPVSRCGAETRKAIRNGGVLGQCGHSGNGES